MYKRKILTGNFIYIRLSKFSPPALLRQNLKAMKKIILTSIVMAMAISMNCQMLKPNPEFNLDFEKTEKGIPAGWNIFGASNYTAFVDTTAVKSGAYSALIQSQAGEAGFKAWGFTLPNYPGKKIT